MRILVAGANGQVGHALMRASWPSSWRVTGLARPELDLRSVATIEHALAVDHDVVINAAAYTAVDKAESEPEQAYSINRDGAGLLAAAANRRGAALITLSTDYVFDGSGTRPWREGDSIAPLNVYGRSKAEGEAAQRAANPRHLILRTSWVYSSHGGNFVKTMLRLGAEREVVRVVADQHGAPTSALELADAIVALAHRIEGGEVDRMAQWGTYHLAGGGETTWAGLAERVLSKLQHATGRSARLVPITTAEYPTPARRPLNSRLDCGRFVGAFGFALPAWEASVDRVLRDLLPGR
jgi:dTDP-4-dehydrorhamnose reductase